MNRRTLSERRAANAEMAANLKKVEAEVAQLVAEHGRASERIAQLEQTARPLVQDRIDGGQWP